MQVWTYRSRVAVVLSVTHKGQPIQDALKLQRLQQMLFDMMDQKHQGIVTIKTVSCLGNCLGRQVPWTWGCLDMTQAAPQQLAFQHLHLVCAVRVMTDLLGWPLNGDCNGYQPQSHT